MLRLIATLLVISVVGFCNGWTHWFTPNPATPTQPELGRLGLGVIHTTDQTGELRQQIDADWYLNWLAQPEPQTNNQFVPMVRVTAQGRYTPNGDALQAAVEAQPGALWIIGNEPDIETQDNASPEAFAQAYHNAREAILAWDSTAQFALGAVGHVTPLRLAYLDSMLLYYRHRYDRAMPIDAWTIHIYILPEERDNWGIGIAVGFSQKRGILYTPEQHIDVSEFERRLVAFRWWMAARGFREKPLYVTEYGLLLPQFDAQTAADYLKATTEILLNTRDDEIGYPADDNRLVQSFAWFALKDTLFHTGTLIDVETNEMTLAGQAWQALQEEQ